jgi:DNA-binding NarL/FixJ family response regulator
VLPLSPTEQKVLALADQGKSYKEIAGELDISINTVNTHVARIMAKTFPARCLAHAAFMRGGPRITSQS